MDMEQKKLEVLSVLAAVLKDNRFDAKFMQGENGSLPLTRIDLPKKGKVGVDVGIEMCFIPMPMARPNTALLQVYVSVLSLPEIPRNCMAELKRAVFYCNDFCAIGQFGVFERGKFKSGWLRTAVGQCGAVEVPTVGDVGGEVQVDGVAG